MLILLLRRMKCNIVYIENKLISYAILLNYVNVSIPINAIISNELVKSLTYNTGRQALL